MVTAQDNEDRQRAAVLAVLAREGGSHPGRGRRTTAIGLLDHLAMQGPWVNAIAYPQYSDAYVADMEIEPAASSSFNQAVGDCVNTMRRALDQGLARDFGAWIAVDRALTTLVAGPSMVSSDLAVLAAAVKSPGERGKGGEVFFDLSVPAPTRMRFARRQGGASDFWVNAMQKASTAQDVWLWLLSLHTWGHTSVLVALRELIDSQVEQLDAHQLDLLASALTGSRAVTSRLSQLKGRVPSEARSLAARRLVLGRMSEEDRHETASEMLEAPLTAGAATQVMSVQVERLEAGDRQLQQVLVNMRACERAGGRLLGHEYTVETVLRKNVAFAREVLDDAWELPTALVVAAERAVSVRLRRQETVLSRAESEGWFGPGN